MKFTFYVTAALTIAGCNSPGGKSANTNANDDSSKQTEITKLIEIKPVKITAGQLPANIKFKGKLQEAWQWQDKLGDNILITSLVDPYRVKTYIVNDHEHTAELHAFHFIKKDTAYKLLWPLSDAVKNCPFDITLAFINAATTITDLDKDGIAESKLQYSIVCRSDVSPAGLKLVMHEDTSKFTLRGFMWLAQSPDQIFDITEKDVNLEKLPKPKEEWEQYSQLSGRYETEKEFRNAPLSFLEYARKEWLKHVKESFD